MQVFYGWSKVTHKFLERMDPDLPFYYHTSTHTRFYEGVIPTFDTTPSKRPQKKHIRRYELLGTNNRVTMAVRGASSLKTQFHNVPLELPPPPGIRNLFIFEYSYSNYSTTKNEIH